MLPPSATRRDRERRCVRIQNALGQSHAPRSRLARLWQSDACRKHFEKDVYLGADRFFSIRAGQPSFCCRHSPPGALGRGAACAFSAHSTRPVRGNLGSGDFVQRMWSKTRQKCIFLPTLAKLSSQRGDFVCVECLLTYKSARNLPEDLAAAATAGTENHAPAPVARRRAL